MDTIQFAEGSSLIMADPEGGQGVRTPPPLENHKNIVFSNAGPDPVENLKATHEPSQHYMTGHQRSAKETSFKMRVANRPIMTPSFSGIWILSPPYQLKQVE